VAFGMLLVVAFSAGLALVLTGIGIALVYAGRARERARVPGLVTRLVPVASAAAVLVAGVLITMRAIGQSGL
jgi:nickel/cobalt transporter (NicO) family protein